MFARTLALLALLAYPSPLQAQPQPSESLPIPSFGFPSAAFRPKFRYWLPDASVSASSVDSDIAALASVGAGGLEFLPFYNYGQTPISTDWSIYGFGTPAFRSLFKAALNSTAAHGLVFDFALGPNQGAGVPAVPESEGLAMELVYGAATVSTGRKLDRLPVPELHFNYEPLQGFINAPELWGGNELVAVVAAEVVSRETRNARGRAGELVVLNEASVVDLTNLTARGRVDWTPPSIKTTGNGTWVVMAFYQRYTNERSCVSVANASTWMGNGSWIVDHFSASGAKKATDFWDQYLLSDDEIKSLVRQVAEYCMNPYAPQIEVAYKEVRTSNYEQ